MTWAWQQPYDAALREKDPSRLPERLTLAEKAIIQRWQELPEPAHELAEGQALREALNRLYALYPHEHHPPGQIQDDETDPARRNWMRIAIPLAMGLTLASAISWMAARRNERIVGQRMVAVAETQALRNSRKPITREAGEIPLLDAGSQVHGSPGASSLSAPGPGGRDRNSMNQNMTGQGAAAQSRNSNSPEAPRVRREAPVVGDISAAPEAAAKTTGNLASAPAAQIDNVLPQNSADDSSANVARDSPNQADAESQSTPADAESRDKSERPRGTVSVNASAYPSIRVPLELRSQSPGVAESLQIGRSISRPAPGYPEEAVREGVEGTVKLRAMVGKDGAVENVEVMSGPAPLASAAADAVRQWRYQPTLLGDQPIEVAEDITIVFRLAGAGEPAN
jgi:TonB family protein